MRTMLSCEHQEWQGLRTDTVLGYALLSVIPASPNAPSRAQIFIGELASRVWDGRAAGARVRPGHSHGS